MPGWRGKIGVLYPSAGLAEEEFAKLAPEGVSVHITRMRMRHGEVDQIRQMVSRVEEAASLLADAGVDIILFNCTLGSVEEAASLLADAGVDIILFNCTLGSLIEGSGFDKRISKKLTRLTGIPATTTTTAVLKAMESLGMRRIILLAPYPEDLLKLELDFLREAGLEVIHYRGLGISDPHKQVGIDPGIWYRLSKELVMTSGDVEGIFISCAGILVVDMIQSIEKDLKLPVVTSNQAAMWECLMQLKIRAPQGSYGMLFNSTSY
jgi:maleate isomerase